MCNAHLCLCLQLVDLVKAYCHGEFSEDVVKVRTASSPLGFPP